MNFSILTADTSLFAHIQQGTQQEFLRLGSLPALSQLSGGVVLIDLALPSLPALSDASWLVYTTSNQVLFLSSTPSDAEHLAALTAGARGYCHAYAASESLQAILNVVDFGMSPVEAVTVPRIHCEGKGIHAEATIQLSVVNELRAMGHKVQHSPHSFEPMMSRAGVACGSSVLRS